MATTTRRTTTKKTAAPRKRAAAIPADDIEDDELEVSDVSSWKTPAKPTRLPSGKVVIIRRVGLRAFLNNGVIPNSLMVIVQRALESGVSDVEDEESFAKDMLKDPEKLNDLMAMADSATVYSVVKPKIHPIPEDEDDRRDDLLYVDELDEQDKMMIFTVATGGTVDLERFRK